MIFVEPTLDKSPALFNCLHSANVERNFVFNVETTKNTQKNHQNFLVKQTKTNSPFLTVLLGLNWPDFNCCVASVKPEPSNCNALTNNTNCSALRPNSVWGCTRVVESTSAANGAVLEAAKSRIQLLSASTKLIFARVSLCSFCKHKNNKFIGTSKSDILCPQLI